MTPETLYCRCGIPVRVVRLGQSYLTLGHTRNPKHNRHPVQLAQASRSALGEPNPGSSDPRGLSGAPARVTHAHGAPPARTSRRTQEMSPPLSSVRAASPRRRAAPASARLPEPSAGKGDR